MMCMLSVWLIENVLLSDVMIVLVLLCRCVVNMLFVLCSGVYMLISFFVGVFVVGG